MTRNNNGASVEPSGGRSLWWTFSSCLALGQNASNIWKLGLSERDFHCFLTLTGGESSIYITQRLKEYMMRFGEDKPNTE